ncbi:MAG: nucleoside recognition domain-containing protein [bacterium]|jgi:ferrous iron transport protein B
MQKANRNLHIRDEITGTIYRQAEIVANKVVHRQKNPRPFFDEQLDAILTSPHLGFPIMFLLLGGIFWITLVGAEYPATALTTMFSWLEGHLSSLFLGFGAPPWLHGIFVYGLYRGLAWVIAVMLPPMAIFFPLFTLFEDLGYLPRVAFNLDRFFKQAGAHGKQALTMCMGFGCNAAGVIACRIIDSPREKLLAILTNNFVPCNGRFPLMITLSTIFWGEMVTSHSNSLIAAGIIVLMVLFGIAVTLTMSWLLSHTILKGIPSTFTLELPPYRPPQVGKILIRSLLDRTLFVLTRALIVAAPAGAITWTLANVTCGDMAILAHVANWLDPFGHALGMDGMIILAFILGLPANEIVLPIALMGYLAEGTMLELASLQALGAVLRANDWNWLTAVNVMLFSLLHYPCATTLLTIFRETGSKKWTLISALLPTGIAIIACFTVTRIMQILQLV